MKSWPLYVEHFDLSRKFIVLLLSELFAISLRLPG